AAPFKAAPSLAINPAWPLALEANTALLLTPVRPLTLPTPEKKKALQGLYKCQTLSSQYTMAHIQISEPKRIKRNT
ncbi:hypothetical protein, partial [Mycobacterium tuberculosis]|uniref:hypothetical protein n=1 Tax=Mycobacterium tuberculosis TaxID=1773 RepID=UPI001ADEE5A9